MADRLFEDTRTLVVGPEEGLSEILTFLKRQGVGAVETVHDAAATGPRIAVFRPDVILCSFDPSTRQGQSWLREIETTAKDDFVSVLLAKPPFDAGEVAERLRDTANLRLGLRSLSGENRRLGEENADLAAQIARLKEELGRHERKHNEAMTVLKKAEERLATALSDSENKSRAKSELIANLSHELRTPLNAIIGFSEMLRDQIFGPHSSPKYVEHATHIHEAGNHLLSLINDIVDISRAESGRLELNFENVDVARTIAGAVRMLESKAKAKSIKLVVDIAADFPQLRTDEKRLRQVLINLISNAVKFTPRNGQVSVKAGVDPADGAFIIVVSDSGIGIDPDDIPLVMSRYGQVKGQKTDPEKGVGLGLPLTQKIVSALGGTIELRTRKGVGTAVTVRFPSSLIVRP